MKAVVFADRLGRELLPLTDRTCPALLPVLSKAVIEHTLEALADAGSREVLLVVSAHAEQFKQILGIGTRWGIQLEYVLSRGEEEPAALLQRLPAFPEAEFLALRGDLLRSGVIDQFLEQARQVPGALVQAVMGDKPAALCLCRNGGRELTALAWPPNAAGAAACPVVELEGTAVSYLESLTAYHQANLDAAAGRFPGLILPGRQLALGLTVGRGSKVSPKSLKQGVAFVGPGCRIHPDAELFGEVVISADVIVDRYATIRSSLILPGTYVGELVELNNAIVRSNDLIRVDTGAVLHVTDAFLLGDLQQDTLSAVLAVPLNRLLGFALLLLSLPLWPLALALSLLKSPSAPLHATRLRGNRSEIDDLGMRQRRTFTAWEWATTVPVLRYLPRLLGVIAGHLQVVGVTPLTPGQAEARTEEWERLGDQAPAGLIGPTVLNLPPEAPAEERLLSDAFYARQRTTMKDLQYLLQGLGALFSRRAWVPGAVMESG